MNDENIEKERNGMEREGNGREGKSEKNENHITRGKGRFLRDSIIKAHTHTAQ